MGKTSHRSTATLERIDAARIHRERTIWADFTAPDGGDANAGFALRLGEVIPAQKKKGTHPSIKINSHTSTIPKAKQIQI